MDFGAWMAGVFGFCFMTDDELIQRQPTPHSPPSHTERVQPADGAVLTSE